MAYDKDVQSSGIPVGAPYPIQIRTGEPKEKTSSRSGAPFWIWMAGLPKANLDHQGEYDPQYTNLVVFHPRLQSAITTHISSQPGRKDRDRQVWDIVIVRTKKGDHDEWEVRAPGAGQAAAPSGGNSQRNGLPAGISAKRNLDGILAATRYGYRKLVERLDVPWDTELARATWLCGCLEAAEKIAVSANIDALRSGKDLLTDLAAPTQQQELKKKGNGPPTAKELEYDYSSNQDPEDPYGDGLPF